jgi:hypothetical protein
MNYRLATIWPRQQYTADKTEPIPINLSDCISRMTVMYEPDNNPSGANATAHPAKCITKIELVDGSDVLFTLAGTEAQGVDFYDNSKVPPNELIYLNGMYSTMLFQMNFGRWLWDEMLAIKPKKHKNPQLRVTIDIDGGGDEPNDGYLTVIAHCFDQKVVEPMGFLMSKRVKQFTLADSSHDYTDLPLDYPYRQIFVRAQRDGYAIDSQIANIKLTEDQDKRIPLDHTATQILRNIAAQWPEYEEWILVWGTTTAQYFYCTPCYHPRFTDTQWRSAVATAEASIYSGNGGRFQHDAEAAGPNHQVHALGHLPHAVIPLLPKFSDMPEDWYNINGIGNLKLDITGGSSVGTSQTAEILTQQLRRY